MADEISTTVKTTSDGMVKITLEKYQLLAQAAEKPPVIHRTVHRTPEVQARDNTIVGLSFIAVGAALVGVGTYRLSWGLRVLRGLKK